MPSKLDDVEEEEGSPMMMELMRDNGREQLGEEGEEEDECREKSKLDGLVEKAMNTVALVIKQQNQQQRTTPENTTRPWNESDGAGILEEWTCQVNLSEKDVQHKSGSIQVCQAALKPGTNLLRHVAKDHLNLALYQCPICENHGAHSAYEGAFRNIRNSFIIAYFHSQFAHICSELTTTQRRSH